MTDPAPQKKLRLGEALQVVSVDAYSSQGQAHEPAWELIYEERFNSGHWHVLSGLHVSEQDTVATVIIHAHIDEVDGELDESSFAGALREDPDVLDRIYLRTRSTALVLLGLMEGQVNLPADLAPEIISEAEWTARAEQVQRGAAFGETEAASDSEPDSAT